MAGYPALCPVYHSSTCSGGASRQAVRFSLMLLSTQDLCSRSSRARENGVWANLKNTDASELIFPEWERIFARGMVIAASIDRVVHHPIILEFEISSCRTGSDQRRGQKAEQQN